MRDATDDPAGTSSKFPLETLYQAARMYYLEDANQVKISEALDVSRPTVSRLLAEARRIGLVKIEVVNPSRHASGSLGAELAEALSLQKVYLADGDQSRRLRVGLLPQVSEAVMDMALAPGDVLLASSGRTIYELSQAVLPRLPGVLVAPSVGGQTEPEPWYQTNEIARAMAEHTGAHPAFLWTQALPSPEMHQFLQQDPDFRRIQRLWESAKGALLGVGAPPTTRSSISRFIPKDDDSLARAVGDICLNFFDARGARVEFPGSDRVVATSAEILHAIPHTVGVAVGTEKASSIVGAARGGYLQKLVTDAVTARAVLDYLAA
ncbi:sugar-binding transcriptional regulator [Arthrobacter sp. NPDC056493]|uniref:sugar-binding transcriptional regulator n=1 Tax=Arthrobacter sp. NPDC056493 TaxID=3345839 RepID=UPI003671F809